MTRTNGATRSITTVRVDAERGTARLVWWPRATADPIEVARPGGEIEMRLVAPQAGAA
jgi:hypothetical protein